MSKKSIQVRSMRQDNTFVRKNRTYDSIPPPSASLAQGARKQNAKCNKGAQPVKVGKNVKVGKLFG